MKKLKKKSCAEEIVKSHLRRIIAKEAGDVGDFPGHPFRGNQYASGEGGGGGKGLRDSKGKLTSSQKEWNKLRRADRKRDALRKDKDRPSPHIPNHSKQWDKIRMPSIMY